MLYPSDAIAAITVTPVWTVDVTIGSELSVGGKPFIVKCLLCHEIFTRLVEHDSF